MSERQQVASLYAEIAADVDTRGLRQFRNEIDATERDLGKLGKSATTSTATAAKGTTALGQAFFYAKNNADTFKDAAIAAYEAAKEGASSIDLRSSVAAKVRAAGGDFEAFRETLRKAAGGAVSDFALMEAASKSMAYGVTSDANQMAQFIEVVRLKSKQTGADVGASLIKALRGVGTGEGASLDDLFAVRPSQVYKEYAAAIGVTVEKLTDAQKKQALLNKIIADGQAEIEALGGSAVALDGLSSKFQSLESDATNLLDKWKETAALIAQMGFELGGGNPLNMDKSADAAQQIIMFMQAQAKARSALSLMEDGELNIAIGMGDFERAMSVINGNAEATRLFDMEMARLTDQMTITSGAVATVNQQYRDMVNMQALIASGMNQSAAAIAYEADALIDNKNAALAGNLTRSQMTQNLERGRAAALANGDAMTDNKNAVVGASVAMMQTTHSGYALGGGLLYLSGQGRDTSGVLDFLARVTGGLGGAMASSITPVFGMVNALNTFIGLAGAAQNLSYWKTQVDPQYGLQNSVQAYANAQSKFAKLSSTYGDSPTMGQQRQLMNAEAQMYRAQSQLTTAQQRLASTKPPELNLGSVGGGIGGVAFDAAGAINGGLQDVAQNLKEIYSGVFQDIKSMAAAQLDFSTNVGEFDGLQDKYGLRLQNAQSERQKQLADIRNRALKGGEQSPWLGYFPELTAYEGEELAARAAALMEAIKRGLRPDMIDQKGLQDDLREAIIGKRNLDKVTTEAAQALMAEGFTNPEIMSAVKERYGDQFSTLGSESGVTLAESMIQSIVGSFDNSEAAAASAAGRFMGYFESVVLNSNIGARLVDSITEQVIERADQALSESI